MEKKKIPLGVKVLSILYYANAAFMLLMSIALLLVGSMYSSFLESGELEQSVTADEFIELQSYGDLTWLFYIFAFASVIGAILNLFLGIAFWKGKNWGRILTIIFACLTIPLALFNLVYAFSLGDVMSLLIPVLQIGINAFILWYLFRKEVIVFFTTPKKNIEKKN